MHFCIMEGPSNICIFQAQSYFFPINFYLKWGWRLKCKIPQNIYKSHLFCRRKKFSEFFTPSKDFDLGGCSENLGLVFDFGLWETSSHRKAVLVLTLYVIACCHFLVFLGGPEKRARKGMTPLPNFRVSCVIYHLT